MARLHRLTLGRLAALAAAPISRVSEAFKTADWTPSTSQTVSLTTTGLLRVTGNGSSRCVRYTPVAARADAFVQAIWQARSDGGTCGIATRISAEAIPVDRIQMIAASGFSGSRTLAEVAASVAVQSDADAGVNDTLPERHSLWARGALADGYAHDPAAAYALAGVAMQTPGNVGVFHSGGASSAVTRDWSEFYAMTTALLTVTGPNDGTWYVDVRDESAVLLATGVPVAGVAELDLFAARVLFPTATRVEIRAVADDSLIVAYEPMERVWGGDAYRYVPTDPTLVGTVARTALGRLAAHDSAPIANVTEAFDTADWTSSGGITPSISSGRLSLSLSVAAATRVLWHTAVADRAGVFQQVFWFGNVAATRFGLIARSTTEALPVDMIFSRGPNSSSSGGNRAVQLVEFDGSATIQSASQGDFLPAFPQRFTLDVDGAVARLRAHGPRIGFQLTGIALLAAGRFGLMLSNDTATTPVVFVASEYYAMTSALLVVNGPSWRNWRARLRNSGGVIVAEADAVAGVATLDLMAAQVHFPEAITIDVLDLDSFNVDAELAPLERVWGGDAYTFGVVPATPTGFAVVDATTDTISLDWNSQVDAATYVLERAAAEAGPFAEITETADTDHDDGGRAAATTYWYRLKARNVYGDSPYTAAISGTTDLVPPGIPDAPTVDNPTASTLDVAWAAVALASSYRVYRSLTAVGGFVLIDEVAGLTLTDSGLDPETEYFYRIAAVNSAGASDQSAAGSGTTAPAAVYPPCTCLLEVYEPDGETIDWEVATDRLHPFPFLLFPSNYGSREIDPVTGAASIATVDVTVADVATTPGNQATGYVTARLAGIFGRRCRLRRFISEALGWYTIADGPASAPRMSETYAGYTWAIRDVREIERRLRAFRNGGTCSIAPPGPIAQWGNDGDGNYLHPGVTPLIGKTLIQFNSTAGEWIGSVQFFHLYDTTTIPGTILVPANLAVSEEGEEAFKSIGDGARSWFPDCDVLWRLAGSDDPWNVARPDTPALYAGRIAAVIPGVIEGTTTPVNALNSVYLYWSPTGPPAGFPTEDGVDLEIILRHRGAASEELPYYYEGTLGGLLADLYDRVLERAPDLGGDVYDPQGLDDLPASYFGGGIRYDAAVLAGITTPVLLRETAPVDDGRNWAESRCYAPSGWIPSIDADGVISPVSRARPTTITGPEISGAIAEPAPDWNAGERVVTAVRYNYRRYFIPGTLSRVAVGTDGIASRDVVVEFRDPAAEEIHEDQAIDFDATTFGAVGAAATSVIDQGGLPIEGQPETAAVLAGEARYEVLERYRNGAPAFRVAVRRSDVPTLRDGDYCPADLSWLPNLEEITRGLTIEAVQVLSIEGLDCEWLTLLLEVTPVVAAPGYDFAPEKIDDDPVPGFDFEPDIISDEEGGS